MYKWIFVLGFLQILFKSKFFKMQNMSFTENYYKIKSVTFSVLLHVGGKPVFEISSNIRHKQGFMAIEDGFRLDFFWSQEEE